MKIFGNAKQDNSYSGISHVTSGEFLRDVETFTEKWDREWIRYFYLHDDKHYFKTYAGNAYTLPVTPNEIAKFSAEETLTRRIDPDHMHTKLQIYLPGDAFVGKDVLEIGCGVGMLGRILGKMVKSYTGYDYSPFALYVAKLTSPSTCNYIHAGDVEAVRKLRNSFDLCFGRHLFIHNNFENATWVLRFLRDVVRDDGIIQADFFRADAPAERIFPAKSPLMENIASCGFFYTDADIAELAEACDLEIVSITRTETPPRVFANFKRRFQHA